MYELVIMNKDNCVFEKLNVSSKKEAHEYAHENYGSGYHATLQGRHDGHGNFTEKWNIKGETGFVSTDEVLESVRSCGGFDNFRHWNERKIAEWVLSNYECSRYVSRKAAHYLYSSFVYQVRR